VSALTEGAHIGAPLQVALRLRLGIMTPAPVPEAPMMQIGSGNRVAAVMNRGRMRLAAPPLAPASGVEAAEFGAPAP